MNQFGGYLKSPAAQKKARPLKAGFLMFGTCLMDPNIIPSEQATCKPLLMCVTGLGNLDRDQKDSEKPKGGLTTYAVQTKVS